MVIEISHREELEPSARVRLRVVDQPKGGSKFPSKSSWDLVDHSGRVRDIVVPEFSSYLLLCDVGASHPDDGLPSAFNKAIRRLSTCWSRYDVAVLLEDPSKGVASQEFRVEIAVETTGNATGFSLEGLECGDDSGGGK